MGKQLTNQEKLFKEEYLVDLKPERAAIAAGYSKTVAHTKAYQWVSNGKIKPHLFIAIKTTLDKQAEKLQLTAETVLKDIIRIGDKAEGAGKYSDALKSRELLGKHLKLFTEKVDVNVDNLTDEELDAKLKRLMEKQGQ